LCIFTNPFLLINSPKCSFSSQETVEELSFVKTVRNYSSQEAGVPKQGFAFVSLNRVSWIQSAMCHIIHHIRLLHNTHLITSQSPSVEVLTFSCVTIATTYRLIMSGRFVLFLSKPENTKSIQFHMNFTNQSWKYLTVP